MKLRTALSVCLVAALAIATTSSWLASPAGAAPAAPCTQKVVKLPPDYKPTVICVEIRDEDTPPTSAPEGGGSNEDDDGCYWELYPIPDGVVPDRPGGVSPDAVMYWEICTNSAGTEFVGPGGAQWWEPDEVPLQSPQQVATEVRVEIATQLHQPTIGADPAVDTPSILDVPTFVAVTNWQGVQTAGGCDPTGTVCVDLVATPVLTFDPAEPGAGTITCAGGGTRYNPNGAEPREQAAAAGACAHRYEHRTGVEDRPGAWPGQVTVTWAVHWAARGGGPEGDFPAIDLSADLPREVEEVQSVVNGAGA